MSATWLKSAWRLLGAAHLLIAVLSGAAVVHYLVQVNGGPFIPWVGRATEVIMIPSAFLPPNGFLFGLTLKPSGLALPVLTNGAVAALCLWLGRRADRRAALALLGYVLAALANGVFFVLSLEWLVFG